MSGQTSVESESRSRTTDPSKVVDSHSRSWSMRERELITEDEARQTSEENVFVFAGTKPPIRGQRLKWFEVMPEVQRFAEEHPPTEPEDLPMPEIGRADTDGHGGQASQMQPEDEPATGDPANGSRRQRRRKRQGQEGGYIEPDV